MNNNSTVVLVDDASPGALEAAREALRRAGEPNVEVMEAAVLDAECRHRRQRPARLQLLAMAAATLSSGLLRQASEDLEKLPRNHKGYVRTKYDLEAIEKARLKRERKAAAKAARVADKTA